jgi:transketolase
VSTSKLEWTDLDRRAVDTVRALAMDSVQKVGNGHPGTAMSLAPAAYLLFQRYLRHDPTDPNWLGRDRFVLSAGHSSLTLYIQLYLSGYGLELDDLKALRTWGSLTPGHPEHGHTAGVETTTGPLGQGVGNAVGMAMAARRERGLLDPTPRRARACSTTTSGASPPTATWRRASRRGVVAGRHPAAGQPHPDLRPQPHLDRGRHLDRAVGGHAARYAAYGWHVQEVDWLADDGTYDENVQALAAAFDKARAVTDRPSFISLRTVIAWPAPDAQNTGKAHGSALGEAEVKATKKVMGMNPDLTFDVDPEVLAHARGRRRARPGPARRVGRRLRHLGEKNPDAAALLDRMRTRTLPEGWATAIPQFPADPKGMATRKASGAVLNAIVPTLPELWGGSADLAESNNTTPKGEPSFLPEDRQSKEFPGGLYGRVLHFGIREHAMGSIMNGITLHGGTRVYGGTFLVFSDYMRPAVRLAALMKLPVTYVWTHDSIGLGEDGPTHQPIEHLAALRAIPGLDVVRPADANETAVAWRTVLEHTDRPAGLALSRQDLPVWDREVFGSAEGTARGGYVLVDASDGQPQVIIVGHRLGGAAGRRGPRAPGSRRAPPPGSCRCRAWSGSASRTPPTSSRCCPAA